MNPAEHLSSALGRRDQAPNRALAEKIATSNDRSAVADLLDLVAGGKAAEKNDAIAVVYEAGRINPALIVPHREALLDLLVSKNNRVLWGALTALDIICDVDPAPLMARLGEMLDAADRGSVIAKDRTMSILVKLNAHPEYAPIVTPVILQRLQNAPTNQFPTYAQMVATNLAADHVPQLINILEKRRTSISYPSKIRTIDKLLKRLSS